MSSGKLTLTTVLALLSTASPGYISQECLVEENKVTCECVKDKEFDLPNEYTYANTTSLSISSCKTARLLFPVLSQAKSMDRLIIRDISEELTFDILLGATTISHLELRNIKKIQRFSRDNFDSLKNIGRLEIRNVFIEYFEEEFARTNVTDLVMVNVTIGRVKDFSFTEWGRNLRIIDTEFLKIGESLNFYFSNVHIANSTFEMEKPGRITIKSDHALVEDNVFYNVTMNLLTNKSIRINGTCVDGASSLTLISKNAKTLGLGFGQKLPKGGIVYSPDKTNDESIGKTTARNANRPVTVISIPQILTLLTSLLAIR